MTYREMWETYVEPNLERQKEYSGGTGGLAAPDNSAPVTIDQKVGEAQAAAMMFGGDVLEVAKAVRASWPPKPGDIQRLRERVAARNQK